MAITKQKFDQGMTPQEYIDQIKVNKQPFLDIYNALDVPDKAKALFDGLDSPLNLAVFTADWCGDAVSTTPVILRLAQATPGLSVQVFNRDDELEITNSFLPENRAGTVPVFIVMDSSMAEIARFVETALELVPAIDAMDDMIAKEIAGESEEDRRAAGRGRRMAFRTSHAQEWGEVIMESFSRTVAEGLKLSPAERPAVGGTKWPPED
ncbi:MAG: thioredoxin family protein [Chloroflexi bacterium]|nr:thioredoxin family protein [Chloroflexota bacterium]MCH8351117.1 thioredoxin family protein [Chloroflexota bacterium]MCI0781507.1 thioredoxin family protein [Chloroflexota bacterium]MCI0786491.1 thioredoxin family protein [Chloroflexota bacterium]MCI0794216.1 thioredoxin family protein [Chloroflexota bacterium]